MKLKFLLLSASTLFFSITLKAQGDLDKLIQGSKADANYLVTGYVTPAFNILGSGLNQGWYNTAKPHKLLGFDLTITGSGIFIPTSDLTYKVDDTQMGTLKNTSPSANLYVPNVNQSINAPTIFGSETAPTYQPIDPQTKAATGNAIQSAPGTNIGNIVPMPMVQLGIGLPKGTDLKLRFFPSTKIGDNGSAGMFGFAIMHDIKQYIPGVKALPFDLSALFGYTNLKVNVDLDPTNNPTQKAEFNTTAMTFQGLISKKFSVLTLYGGLGYNFLSSDLNVKGTFNFTGGSQNDPISISSSQSGPRVTGGFRLKFAIFTLHADYTLQKYSAVTAGFGFNVR